MQRNFLFLGGWEGGVIHGMSIYNWLADNLRFGIVEEKYSQANQMKKSSTSYSQKKKQKKKKLLLLYPLQNFKPDYKRAADGTRLLHPNLFSL